jgi:hypothetical protein
MKVTKVFLSLVLGIFTLTLPVSANVGVWDTTEVKVPLVKVEKENLISYRIFYRTLFTVDKNGLDSTVLRTGPIFRFSDNISLALHGSVIGVNKTNNVFAQENRLEIEPNFEFNMGNFKVSDRNRFEFRFTDKYAFRYRNMVSIFYNSELPIAPYISDEIFLSPSENFSNRITVGFGIPITKQLKVNLGFMNISQLNNKNDFQNLPLLSINILSDLTK